MPLYNQSRRNQFTIYDAMEARGVFLSNPANVGARDDQNNIIYKGPLPYPKMLYHPEGKEKQVSPEVKIPVPGFGIQIMPATFEMISMIVAGPEEHQKMADQGWHDSPAKALKWKTLHEDGATPEEISEHLARMEPNGTVDEVKQGLITAAKAKDQKLADQEKEIADLRAKLAEGAEPVAPSEASQSGPRTVKTIPSTPGKITT